MLKVRNTNLCKGRVLSHRLPNQEKFHEVGLLAYKRSNGWPQINKILHLCCKGEGRCTEKEGFSVTTQQDRIHDYDKPHHCQGVMYPLRILIVRLIKPR